MKKIILFALFTLVSLVTSAQNNTYNMVIELANGTKITIGPNDIRNISFNEGQLVITGEDLNTFVNHVNNKTDSLNDDIRNLQVQIDAHSAEMNAIMFELKSLHDLTGNTQEFYNAMKTQNTAMQAQINDLQAILEYNYYTKQEVQSLLNNLSSNDSFTKDEILNLLKNYITNEYLYQHFYTKEDVMNIIMQALSEYYSKDVIMDLLKDYYNKAEINALLNR